MRAGAPNRGVNDRAGQLFAAPACNDFRGWLLGIAFMAQAAPCALGVSLSTLAHGVPIGGELDYLDDGTLNTAFTARRVV